MKREPAHVIALSGGKDSTAMALRMRELEPDRDFTYFCSPTGDELPPMEAHWARLEEMLGRPMTRVSNGTLAGWVEHWKALPSFRMRWCTRVLKIQPCLAYFEKLAPGSVLYVGLRADEEARRGIYSDSIDTRFPLREWGWGVGDVRRYLRSVDVTIPPRTDCARCYGQRLSEWWELWKAYPSTYQDAARQEAEYQHTYRSDQRDSWPASLVDLAAEFAAGRVPRGVRLQVELPGLGQDDDRGGCRVCRL